MKIVIIIPTYNERGNIAALIDALESQFVSMAHDMHILVVDDNSPDGTGDVVRELMPRLSNVHLLEGEKEGLGVAYTAPSGTARGIVGGLWGHGGRLLILRPLGYGLDARQFKSSKGIAQTLLRVLDLGCAAGRMLRFYPYFEASPKYGELI